MQKILIGLVALLVAVVVAGLVMPTTYAVEKEITIDATPADIHAYVGDLKKWPEWTPWEQADETIETTYGETTTGVGASQSWISEDGDGELKITECDARTGIAYRMEFIMGDTRSPAECAMTYTRESDTTTVTWTMQGDADGFMPPVVGGLMTPFLEGSIGGMFDQGLSNLKKKIEDDQ